MAKIYLILSLIMSFGASNVYMDYVSMPELSTNIPGLTQADIDFYNNCKKNDDVMEK